MESKMEILNRVTLIMNYDSAKTLNENKKSLNIIDEQPVPLKPIVRDLEGSLGALRGVERTALKDAFKTEAKNMIRSDGSAIKNVNELESALKNGELGPSAVRLLKNRLLRDVRVGPKLKQYLMDDLIQSPRFDRKYKKFNDAEVKAELRKYYNPAQAEEIGNRYVKSRGYTDVNPANGEPIRPTTGEVPPTGEYFGNQTSTLGNRPVEYVKPEVKPEVKLDSQGGSITSKPKADVSVTGDNARIDIDQSVTYIVNNGKMKFEKLPPREQVKVEDDVLSKFKEVDPKTIPDESVITISKPNGTFEKGTKKTLMQKYKGVIRFLKYSTAATVVIGVGSMVGLAWWLLRKNDPESTFAALDSQGGALDNNSNNNQVEIPPPVDPNTAAPSTAPAPVRPSTQQQQPEKPAKNLSLTNVLNSIDKPDPNALSQEEKNHLINSIRNGKKYVGVDLNPAQRAFVDQYMKNTNVRVPSKEKLKYSDTGEPIQQKIKYGNKL